MHHDHEGSSGRGNCKGLDHKAPNHKAPSHRAPNGRGKDPGYGAGSRDRDPQGSRSASVLSLFGPSPAGSSLAAEVRELAAATDRLAAGADTLVGAPTPLNTGERRSEALPDSLQQLLRRRDTWIGQDFARTGTARCSDAANSDHREHPHLATGFAALDAQLSEGGWPLGSCIEILTDAHGMGAMGLFLPAMQALSQQSRWQAFITPPYTPYAPLLAARDIDTQQVLLVHPRDREEQLWSTEQALRSGTCSAVFSWLGSECRYAELRRLQLAAAQGDTLAVLFRPREAARQHAPAGLRLQMKAYREVQILKQHGGLREVTVYLPPEDDIPHQPQLWELPADTDLASSRAVS
ncbi:MAG: translesion DNA synthesis-associated protein ImuA [Halieaceae bacterium]|jgi:cell division inhibitor SulA|nr:translesion DNA synthesis-associated protein ImuA [Halieaceae bacterium]